MFNIYLKLKTGLARGKQIAALYTSLGDAASLSAALGRSQAPFCLVGPSLGGREIWIPTLVSAGHVLTTFLTLIRDKAPVWTQPLEKSRARPKCAALVPGGPSPRSLYCQQLLTQGDSQRTPELRGLKHHMAGEQNKGKQK